MLAKASLFALVGAVAVSALDSRAVHSIITRQLSASSIPSACQSTCSSALTIYNACLNGDTQTCLSVCQSDNYQGFIGCFGCILDNTPGVTDAEVSQLNDAIAQLSSACAAAGQTVSAASLTAPSGAVSGAASGDASASGILESITGASFTSASGGLTVGGAVGSSTSSAGAAVTSRASSASAAVNSATSRAASAASSAAAASSGAAGVAAQFPNFVGIALGLVGVGAGAVLAL